MFQWWHDGAMTATVADCDAAGWQEQLVLPPRTVTHQAWEDPLGQVVTTWGWTSEQIKVQVELQLCNLLTKLPLLSCPVTFKNLLFESKKKLEQKADAYLMPQGVFSIRATRFTITDRYLWSSAGVWWILLLIASLTALQRLLIVRSCTRDKHKYFITLVAVL